MTKPPTGRSTGRHAWRVFDDGMDGFSLDFFEMQCSVVGMLCVRRRSGLDGEAGRAQHLHGAVHGGDQFDAQRVARRALDLPVGVAAVRLAGVERHRLAPGDGSGAPCQVDHAQLYRDVLAHGPAVAYRARQGHVLPGAGPRRAGADASGQHRRMHEDAEAVAVEVQHLALPFGGERGIHHVAVLALGLPAVVAAVVLVAGDREVVPQVLHGGAGAPQHPLGGDGDVLDLRRAAVEHRAAADDGVLQGHLAGSLAAHLEVQVAGDAGPLAAQLPLGGLQRLGDGGAHGVAPRAGHAAQGVGGGGPGGEALRGQALAHGLHGGRDRIARGRRRAAAARCREGIGRGLRVARQVHGVADLEGLRERLHRGRRPGRTRHDRGNLPRHVVAARRGGRGVQDQLRGSTGRERHAPFDDRSARDGAAGVGNGVQGLRALRQPRPHRHLQGLRAGVAQHGGQALQAAGHAGVHRGHGEVLQGVADERAQERIRACAGARQQRGQAEGHGEAPAAADGTAGHRHAAARERGLHGGALRGQALRLARRGQPAALRIDRPGERGDRALQAGCALRLHADGLEQYRVAIRRGAIDQQARAAAGGFAQFAHGHVAELLRAAADPVHVVAAAAHFGFELGARGHHLRGQAAGGQVVPQGLGLGLVAGRGRRLPVVRRAAGHQDQQARIAAVADGRGDGRRRGRLSQLDRGGGQGSFLAGGDLNGCGRGQDGARRAFGRPEPGQGERRAPHQVYARAREGGDDAVAAGVQDAHAHRGVAHVGVAGVVQCERQLHRLADGGDGGLRLQRTAHAGAGIGRAAYGERGGGARHGLAASAAGHQAHGVVARRQAGRRQHMAEVMQALGRQRGHGRLRGPALGAVRAGDGGGGFEVVPGLVGREVLQPVGDADRVRGLVAAPVGLHAGREAGAAARIRDDAEIRHGLLDRQARRIGQARHHAVAAGLRVRGIPGGRQIDGATGRQRAERHAAQVRHRAARGRGDGQGHVAGRGARAGITHAGGDGHWGARGIGGPIGGHAHAEVGRGLHGRNIDRSVHAVAEEAVAEGERRKGGRGPRLAGPQAVQRQVELDLAGLGGHADELPEVVRGPIGLRSGLRGRERRVGQVHVGREAQAQVGVDAAHPLQRHGQPDFHPRGSAVARGEEAVLAHPRAVGLLARQQELHRIEDVGVLGARVQVVERIAHLGRDHRIAAVVVVPAPAAIGTLARLECRAHGRHAVVQGLRQRRAGEAALGAAQADQLVRELEVARRVDVGIVQQPLHTALCRSVVAGDERIHVRRLRGQLIDALSAVGGEDGAALQDGHALGRSETQALALPVGVEAVGAVVRTHQPAGAFLHHRTGIAVEQRDGRVVGLVVQAEAHDLAGVVVDDDQAAFGVQCHTGRPCQWSTRPEELGRARRGNAINRVLAVVRGVQVAGRSHEQPHRRIAHVAEDGRLSAARGHPVDPCGPGHEQRAVGRLRHARGTVDAGRIGGHASVRMDPRDGAAGVVAGEEHVRVREEVVRIGQRAAFTQDPGRMLHPRLALPQLVRHRHQVLDVEGGLRGTRRPPAARVVGAPAAVAVLHPLGVGGRARQRGRDLVLFVPGVECPEVQQRLGLGEAEGVVAQRAIGLTVEGHGVVDGVAQPGIVIGQAPGQLAAHEGLRLHVAALALVAGRPGGGLHVAVGDALLDRRLDGRGQRVRGSAGGRILARDAHRGTHGLHSRGHHGPVHRVGARGGVARVEAAQRHALGIARGSGQAQREAAGARGHPAAERERGGRTRCQRAGAGLERGQGVALRLVHDGQAVGLCGQREVARAADHGVQIDRRGGLCAHDRRMGRHGAVEQRLAPDLQREAAGGEHLAGRVLAARGAGLDDADQQGVGTGRELPRIPGEAQRPRLALGQREGAQRLAARRRKGRREADGCALGVEHRELGDQVARIAAGVLHGRRDRDGGVCPGLAHGGGRRADPDGTRAGRRHREVLAHLRRLGRLQAPGLGEVARGGDAQVEPGGGDAGQRIASVGRAARAGTAARHLRIGDGRAGVGIGDAARDLGGGAHGLQHDIAEVHHGAGRGQHVGGCGAVAAAGESHAVAAGGRLQVERSRGTGDTRGNCTNRHRHTAQALALSIHGAALETRRRGLGHRLGRCRERGREHQRLTRGEGAAGLHGAEAVARGGEADGARRHAVDAVAALRVGARACAAVQRHERITDGRARRIEHLSADRPRGGCSRQGQQAQVQWLPGGQFRRPHQRRVAGQRHAQFVPARGEPGEPEGPLGAGGGGLRRGARDFHRGARQGLAAGGIHHPAGQCRGHGRGGGFRRQGAQGDSRQEGVARPAAVRRLRGHQPLPGGTARRGIRPLQRERVQAQRGEIDAAVPAAVGLLPVRQPRHHGQHRGLLRGIRRGARRECLDGQGRGLHACSGGFARHAAVVLLRCTQPCPGARRAREGAAVGQRERVMGPKRVEQRGGFGGCGRWREAAVGRLARAQRSLQGIGRAVRSAQCQGGPRHPFGVVSRLCRQPCSQRGCNGRRAGQRGQGAHGFGERLQRMGAACITRKSAVGPDLCMQPCQAARHLRAACAGAQQHQRGQRQCQPCRQNHPRPNRTRAPSPHALTHTRPP